MGAVTASKAGDFVESDLGIMPIIPPPPESVADCQLVAGLRRKSSPADGAIDKAVRFIEVASPLVDMIGSGPFREYTLHNRDHCKKLLHLAEAIVPESTMQALSPLEHLICIYAAYLHDMGMALTSMERTRILESDDFQDALQASVEIADALSRARRRLDSVPAQNKLPIETEIYQLQEAALAGFLRPRHALTSRYRALVADLKRHSNRTDLFEYRGVSLRSSNRYLR